MVRAKFLFSLLGVLGAAALVVGVAGSMAGAQKTRAITPSPAYTAKELSTYAGADWLTTGGDLQDDRYSSLTQINASNVSNLQQAWHIHLGECPQAVTGAATTSCPGQEENAVVADGIMYLSTSKSQVFAIDATNGTVLWHYVPTFDPGFSIGSGGRNPGVSIGAGKVFLGQRDGKVVALDQTTGNVIWTASTGPWQKGIRL